MAEHLRSSSETKPSVLVVDDEARLGRFICMLLTRAGYTSITCQSVAEARALIKRKAWDVVLTDLVMPAENGFHLVEWIGENHPGIPVVVMSAHLTRAIEHQAGRLGVAGTLQKPFSDLMLRQTIGHAAQAYALQLC